jgi:hypothetical protein
MAYIGVSPSNGVRKKHTYTATASQTSFSGAGDEGITLAYRDSNYVDVYQNGVKLADEDYTATSGTAIVLAQGASADDIVEIIAFDVFSVADTVSKADGGTFDGNVTMAGTLGVTGIATFTDDIIIGDGKTIGSASDVDAITIHSNGVVSASAGVALGVGTANTASNVLDDYEEGTFVVGITATTGTLGIGATTNNLSYTKIGQVVHFRGYINNDTFSGASGDVTITGFPFAVSDLTKFSERPAILISVIGSSDNGAKAGIMTATATTVIMQNFDASSLDS